MPKPTNKPMRLAQKKRRRRIRIFLSIVVCMILLYAGAGFASQSHRLAIHTVTISGAQALSPHHIEMTARGALSNVRGLCFSTNTILTYNQKAIVDTLLFDYPRIQSIQIQTHGMHTMQVAITERTQVGYWCSDTACYMLDKSGYLFERVATSSAQGVLYQGGVHGEPMRQSFLHGHFPQLHAFVSQLPSLHATPLQVHIEEGATTASIITAEYPTIRILLDGNLERSFSYLTTVLNSAEFQSAQAEGTLQYIDLRFNNRVYYK